MEFLIIWLMFGIFCAVIANKKGRSGLGSFFIGILFGPFGPIFALVVGKNNAVVEQATLNSGEIKRCPHCAELVKRDAIKCRYCGESTS